MKKLLAASVVAVALHASAFAQEQPDARGQVLANRLLAEINASIACDTSSIQLRQLLVSSQAEIKRLKDKYEPAPVSVPEGEQAKP